MKKSTKVYLGFDMGASNGRAVLGLLDKGRLRIEEIYRFPNMPVELDGTLYWNFFCLWTHVLEGLRICSRRGYSSLSGIGVDTWGVDFGLLGRDGRLLGNPVHYRDNRTEGIERKLVRRVKAEDIYRLTGLAVGRVSSFSQLAAMNRSEAKRVLETADCFLMMPDLFRYFLCGKKACELTIAGSSQLLDVQTGKWCQRLFRTFDLPLGMMPKLITPGTIVGTLLPEIAVQTGMRAVPVIAVAGHDTASAAAAVPVAQPDTAFLSSGTWSVLGITMDKPVTSTKALKRGFMNELGLCSVLFVKNLMGLYLVEKLRQAWMKQGDKLSYADLVKSASEAKPFRFFLDINSPLFFTGQDTETAIRTFLRLSGQRTSAGRGEIMRTLLESLAFSYRQALEELKILTQKKFKKLSVIGGGVRNRLLCQFTADATGLEVVAGPAEATVIGNLCIQALATGELQDTSDIQGLVARSFRTVTYEPQASDCWEKKFERYKELIGKVEEKRKKGGK